MRTLKPDLDAARRHLHALTGERDPVVAWQLFSDTDKNNRKAARSFHGRIADVVTDLVEAQQSGCGVFIAVNATDGKGRKAGNMRHARAVFLDLDGAPLPPMWPVEPHLVVNSSSVDGTDKFQCWWFIEPTDDWDLWQKMQKAIAMRFGGDLKCCVVTQVARLAGFYHQKRPDQPWRVRIIHDAGNVVRYRLGDLKEAFGFDLSAVNVPHAGQRQAINRPSPAHGWDADIDVVAARRLVADPDSWASTSDGGVSVYKMACRLRDLGISETLAVEMMREAVPRYPASWPDDHIERKTRHAFKYAQNDAGAGSIEADRRALVAAVRDPRVKKLLEYERRTLAEAIRDGKGTDHV